MKKGGKGKKGKKEEEVKPDIVLSKIDFGAEKAHIKNPIYVKVKCFHENFVIYTEEYEKSIKIKENIAKLKEIPVENIKLYYKNKRIIEDETTNHDQQIHQQCLLYATFKKEDDTWDNINEVIEFNRIKEIDIETPLNQSTQQGLNTD